MDELIHALWPALTLLVLTALGLAVWRYLFARKCWRCGTRFDRFARARKLWGFIPRTYCRRCGAKSIRLR